jgi:glycosyltransferase involved in cell wall biosynthesis
MKILVFGNGSLSLVQQERKIVVEFAKMGHSTYLLCNQINNNMDSGQIPSDSNLHIVTAPFSEYQFDNYMEYFQQIKPDVCLGMDQSVSPFVAEFQEKMHIPSFCMVLDFPVHVIDGNDVHNYNFSYSQRFYYWMMCCLNLTGVIFNNTVAVEEFYHRYKKESKLVWYGTSLDNYHDSIKVKATKNYVVGCNRIIRYKGTEYTLGALRKLPYPYKHIFVSADNNEFNNISMIANSMENDIKFYRAVGENEKMDLIYNAKLFVYPQVTEWIGGLGIIEGFSVKTPGICFDYPVLREIYGDGALYAKRKSVIDLRDKIKQLYEDNDLNDELSQKGYDRFKKYFTMKTMASNLLEVLSEQK